MDISQREHIDKNLVKLIEFTRCNTQLLASLVAAKVLGKSDVESLSLSTMTDLDKSALLYKILPQRDGAYRSLMKALEETMQTGALKILQQVDTEYPCYGSISYDENHLLGKGRLGTQVFKGSFGGRDVAVKVIHADLADTEYAMREVEILKQLDNHENIVHYYFAERNEKFIYIALELCFINLQNEMESKQVNMNPIEILENCTKGVAHLHKNNILHRNLRPSCVLLNIDKQVKLSGFGLSEKIPDGRSNVTFQSEVLGTSDWMAPELFPDLNQNSVTITTASDIFSLGCIFYFVLTNGQHPFGILGDRQYNIRHDKPQLNNSQLEDKWVRLVKLLLTHSVEGRPSAENILLKLNELINPSSGGGAQSKLCFYGNEPQTSMSSSPKNTRSTRSLPLNIVPIEKQILHDPKEDKVISAYDDVHSTQELKACPESRNEQSCNEIVNVSHTDNFDNNIAHNENLHHTLLTATNQIDTSRTLHVLFKSPVPGVKEFLETASQQNEILIIRTFDINICISRIQDTVNIELPIVHVSMYDDKKGYAFIHPISIARVNILGAEELEILTSVNRSILVVTHEILVDLKEIKKIDDTLSWEDLTESHQTQLVQNLKKYKCKIFDDSEVLSLLGSSMIEDPHIYSNLSNNELSNLINNYMNLKVIAVIVTCFLSYHVDNYFKLKRVPMRDIIFALAPEKERKNFSNYNRNNAGFDYSYFVTHQIVKKYTINPNVAFVPKFSCFGDFFTAQLITKAYLDRTADQVVVRKHLINAVRPVQRRGEYFDNKLVTYFLDTISIDKYELRFIINKIRLEKRTIEACFCSGHFEFLTKVLQLDENVIKDIDILFDSLKSFRSWQEIDKFMNLFKKSNISIKQGNNLAELLYKNLDHVTPLPAMVVQTKFDHFELLLRKYKYQQIIGENKIPGLLNFFGLYDEQAK